MNRRSAIESIAALFGIASTAKSDDLPQGTGSHDYDKSTPLLLASSGLWYCSGELRILNDTDGMSCRLQQRWRKIMPCGQGVLSEWRDVPIVGR